ncbi:DNA polymerase subunit beta [Candidatus Entotheonella serta]|nr:DNA polymerase subunit beta [Candidatus Entotheonella serta]
MVIMMIDLEAIQLELNAICQEFELQQLDLIGSAVRDDFSPESDIDVLVTFQGDENLVYRFFCLKDRLEQLFGRKVDVIEERAIRNPYFKRAVNHDRIPIYAA